MKVKLSAILLSLFIVSFSLFQAPTVESSEVHDVAVSYVTVWPTRVIPIVPVHFNVTVENQGTTNESFSLTVYAGNITIQTVSVTDLAPGVSETLRLEWHIPFPDFVAQFFPPPRPPDEPLLENVTIWAEVDVVDGEVDIVDNVYFDGVVTIVWWPPDLDGNGRIDIFDIVRLIEAYGTTLGDPGYDPLKDLNQDGKVDIFDIVISVPTFGSQYS